MFFVEHYPWAAISVTTFPVLFFPAQVIMGIESISDVIESQSAGLKNVMRCFTGSLIASLIRFNRQLKSDKKVGWRTMRANILQ